MIKITPMVLGAVSKLSFCPIFVLAEKINPQNIQHIIPVNFFSRLELEQKFYFRNSP
jgi:hypothetical protein